MKHACAALLLFLLGCSSPSANGDAGVDGASEAAPLGPSGQIDRSFGKSGLAEIPLALENYDIIGHIGVGADSSIVVCANVSTGFGCGRFDAGGKLVSTIGVTIPNAGVAYDFALDSASRIVVVTDHATGTTTDGFAVARIGTDGNLDTTFGSGGTAVVTGIDNSVAGIGVAPDGTIIVPGTATSNGGSFVARFAATGAYLGAQTAPSVPFLTTARFAPDGSFYAITNASNANSGSMVRFDATGAQDMKLGTNGTLSAVPSGAADAGFVQQFAVGITQHALGDGVALGWASYAGTNTLLGAAVHTSSGDTTLAPTSAMSPPTTPLIRTTALLPDGRVLIGGEGTQPRALVAELLTDGGLVPAFDTSSDGGTGVLLSLGFYDVRAFAFDAQGAILVAGPGGGFASIELARLFP